MARLTNISRQYIVVSPYYPVGVQVWGSPLASLACDVFGRPRALARRNGRHLWEGIRATQLCVCRKKERGVADARHLAYGVAQNHFPLFVDFFVMCVEGHDRRTVFDEVAKLGVGTARGPVDRLHIVQPTARTRPKTQR